MSYVVETHVESLLIELRPILSDYLSSSMSSSGDLGEVETALGVTIQSVRTLLVSNGLEAAQSSIPQAYYCSSCGNRMISWGQHKRPIVTAHGEGAVPVRRYRCSPCRHDVFPLLTRNGLEDGIFTIGARRTVAEDAAYCSFSRTAQRMQALGIRVSPSEVENIADQVATWRMEEEEAVRSFLLLRGRDLNLPLHNTDEWISEDAAMIVSVDGANVRSNIPSEGAVGMQWFEIRAAAIGLNTPNAPKICIAGDMSPDKLFETTWSQVRQLPKSSKQKLVFVADGANWIWDRVHQWFPEAVQLLDIYHAGEHVASAAKAAWGQDHPESKLWATSARSRLLQHNGTNQIIRTFTRSLRQGPVNEKLLRTELSYLWRNRTRMRYSKAQSEGLPVGSGIMESVIKQTCAQRLRQPGMKWTRQGANLMLRLRAAVLSDSLQFTTQRQYDISKHRFEQYRKAI